MAKFQTVLKRDGRAVPFDQTKIADAVYRAAQAAGGESRFVAEELAEAVTLFLEKGSDGTPPHIEQIQDLVEKVLMETGHVQTAKAYILYRERRTQIRNSLRVRKPAGVEGAAVKVSPGTREEMAAWDREKIVLALEVEAQLDPTVAREIAAAVEQKIFSSGLTQVSTSLIRELVDNELFSRGLSATLEKQAVIGIPKFDLDQILFARGKTNHKVVTNNPEAINLAIAEHTLKQYALDEVFSAEVSEAHLSGMIHVHDLGYPTRIYMATHSLEFLKRYGLVLETIDVSSAPARHPSSLTSQLYTFLGAMQSYAAGPQGIEFLNVLYAPFIEDLSERELYQEAQRILFDGAQHAFSRGGQTLFVDLNIYPDVPGILRPLEAIGPGGKPTGRPYGSYREAAQRMARALLQVWSQGDQYGGIFCFPKCDFHVMAECFREPPARSLLYLAAELAAHNGVPVFVFDREESSRFGPPLRLPLTPFLPISRLESLRQAALQSVTLNLPQAAYRAGGGRFEETLREVDRSVDRAVLAHLQKRKFLGRLAASSRLPLWQLGRTVRDGNVYLNLLHAPCTLGLMGLNECLACAAGQELHAGREAQTLASRILERVQERARQHEEDRGIRLCLEETPSENAARRLAFVDYKSFPLAAEFVRGDPDADEAYYTNGVKIRADSAVPFSERWRIEGQFHPWIPVHALTQAFVSDPPPRGDEIFQVLQKAYRESLVSQVAFTPTFTFCPDCRSTVRGPRERCSQCDSASVTALTRIADYFSRTSEWNRSKQAEFRSRHRMARLD
ncbi:MAG: anaerobic ribonucleoside-triphosphate reductase [Planctomycetes bacterium]|nr:anaerobic ribonucleoside-triphosphate reductase [Planctomycetota bacterium]